VGSPSVHRRPSPSPTHPLYWAGRAVRPRPRSKDQGCSYLSRPWTSFQLYISKVNLATRWPALQSPGGSDSPIPIPIPRGGGGGLAYLPYARCTKNRMEYSGREEKKYWA
jgi:hypothetical protein